MTTEQQLEHDTLTATYVIPGGNHGRFTEEIAKLNKRCRRLRIPEIHYTVEAHHWDVELCEQHNPYRDKVWVMEADIPAFMERHPAERWAPTGRKRQWLAITVTGATPRLPGGWAFVATLEPLAQDDGNMVNIIRTVPGEECPRGYRDRVGECDHCRQTRNRRQTFIVRNETGEHKCIGRQCLKDFLGHKDPHALAQWAELLHSIGTALDGCTEESWGGGGWVPDTYELEYFLQWVGGVIRERGWISGKAAYENPSLTATRDTVWDLIGSPPRHPDARKVWREARAQCTPGEKEMSQATEAVEWARSIPDETTERNDYLANLNAIARNGIVTAGLRGFAASMLVAYNNDLAKRLEREALPPSRHIGKVGERLEIEVTCIRTNYSDGEYGITCIHGLRDAEGNDLTWFASDSARHLEVGHRYRVRATVKKHGEFRGREQTVVNRVQVLVEFDHEEETSDVAG